LNKIKARVILALIFMKNIWRILLALLIPLNLAMVCIYINYLLTDGFTYSGNYGLGCSGLLLDCGRDLRLLFATLLTYSASSLILLSFFLPVIVILRNRSDKQQNFLIKF
jgi:hypothetical protein